MYVSVLGMLQRIKTFFTKSGGQKILSSADLADLLGAGSGTSSGVSVSPASAMRCVAVFACVRILGESIGQLPLILYRKTADGKERAVDHPLYSILHDKPNGYQTSFEFRELGMARLNLRGNYHCFINWVGSGKNRRVHELLPLENVVVKQHDDWGIEYTARIGNKTEVIPPGNIFKVIGLSLDGFTGISPISYARESIGLSLATERHGGNVFRTGARPGGVLVHPQTLSKEAAAGIKERWEAAHGGDKQGGTAVLEEGMEYKAISMSNEDAQFLETRKFQKPEIASIFRVPPHMIGDLEKSSFSNITQQSLEFAKYTVLPWARRWEQCITRDLLSEADQKAGYYVEFLLDGLERADIQTRHVVYRSGINAGIYSPNECRAKENMNPYEGGDTYLRPLNMVPHDQPVFTPDPPPAAGKNSAAPDTKSGSSIKERNKLRDSYKKRFLLAAGAMVAGEVADVRKAVAEHLDTKSAETLKEWLDEYYSRFAVSPRMKTLIAEYMEKVSAAALAETDEESVKDLQTFIDDYTDGLSNRHGGSSVGQLTAIINDSEPDALADDLDTRLAEWDDTRAGKIASQEVVQGGESVSRFTWAAAGAVSLIWVTQGSKTCPFCHQLAGKKVGIYSPFLASGDSITASNGSGMKINGKKLHAPIHRGCVCTTVPGF